MGAVTLLVGDLDGDPILPDVVTLAVISREPPCPRPRRPPDRRPDARARAAPRRRPGRRACSTPRSSSRRRRALAARSVLGRPPRARHLHRLGRPPGEPGVLLHRPRGQRHRALLGPRPHRVVVGPRSGRDGHPLPRPERASCASISPRRPRSARPRGTRHPSVMSICRWGMSRPHAPSTSTPSGSTRPRASATRPCS